MNKELQKLLKQINDKKNEVKSLVNDGKLDKARTAKEELVELQNRFDLLYDLDEDEQDGIENKVKDGTAKQVGGDVKPDKKNIVKSFVNIVKAGFLHKEADEADIKVYKDALTSDTTAGSEGEVGIGVTIPEDIRTDIIELRRSSDNLEQYVNVEDVTTKTGTRNIEVDAESTPFDNVDEAADFPEMDEPKFLPIEYKVKKKGGILKMTAELLEDTASNIMAYLNDNLDLEIKGDWQVFRFEYPVFDKGGNPVLDKDGKQVTKGRMLDFMGFQFHHDRTTIRKSNIEAARRKANHISKQDKISWYNASVMLSYMGLFKHTDTYNYYIDYIKPKINVKKLKRIVSKHSRKENEHDRLEKGDRNTAGQAGGGRQDIVAVNGLPA